MLTADPLEHLEHVGRLEAEPRLDRWSEPGERIH